MTARSADPGADELLFLPLGGAGEIGMNLNLYGHAGKWLMVDCGVTFADEGLPGIDLITPDIDFIAERRRDLVALILTHAHEDHLGAVPHLWRELRCPVYATPFCAGLLRRKLDEVGLGGGQVPIHHVQGGQRLRLPPFDLEFIGITHSIPEMNAVAITTPLGTVMHTGDWKFDPDPLVGETTDFDRLKAWGDAGVLAMVCDSTNVFVDGESGSEGALADNLLALVKGFPGRVALTTFASNVARLDLACRVAATAGRRVCLVGRSMHRIVDVAKECGYLKHLPAFIDEREAEFVAADRILYLCTGCQGEPRGAMARIASGDHPSVGLNEGDRVIFSSRIIPGNELAIGRLHNDLVKQGIDVVTTRDHDVHVSGHPARDELARMYRLIRPGIAVPVHGEARHIAHHVKLAESLQVPQAVAVENGQVLRLAPGPAEVVDHVPSGRLAVDAGALVPLDSPAIKQRRKLAAAGMVIVTLLLDERDRLAGAPRVLLSGVAEPLRAEALAEGCIAAVARSFGNLTAAERRSMDSIDQAVRRGVRMALKSLDGRRPPIELQVIRLDDLDDEDFEPAVPATVSRRKGKSR